MPRVYLAGPIEGNTYADATMWRDIVVRLLEGSGISVFSPMRGKEFLNAGDTRLVDDGRYAKHAITSPSGIVGRDRNDVMCCDAMLVNIPQNCTRVSIGTMVELGWADAYRKPIVLVSGYLGIHDHAFVRQLATYLVPTITEGAELVRYLLLP